MKAKKIILVGSTFFLVMTALVLAGHMNGCRPYGYREGGPFPGFCDRGFPHRFKGKDFAGHLLARLDRRVEKLNLTEDQKRKYGDLRRQLEANLRQGLERRKRLFGEVREEIGKENPDMERVAGILKGGLREFPARMEAHLNLFVAFYNTLDEDQRALVLKEIRDKTDCG